MAQIWYNKGYGNKEKHEKRPDYSSADKSRIRKTKSNKENDCHLCAGSYSFVCSN